MNPIDSEDDARRFLDRFYGFSDALLRRVEVDFGSSRTGRPAAVVLELGKQDGHDGDRWATVRVRVEATDEFCLSQRCSHDIDVLYDGLSIASKGERWIVSLTETGDPGEERPDGPTFFVCGRQIRWDVADYRE